MNQHPNRERTSDKPTRPPHEDWKPDDEFLLEAGDDSDEGDGRAIDPGESPLVKPISREAAEKGIPPEPDPDDPVSR